MENIYKFVENTPEIFTTIFCHAVFYTNVWIREKLGFLRRLQMYFHRDG